MDVRGESLVVVGLGYVGLPLAVALAQNFKVTGFDIDSTRIDELSNGHDRTREVSSEKLKASNLIVTTDPDKCRDATIFICTVPTPVDARNRPDLGPLLAATRTIAGMIKGRSDILIIYESTVYPGVTEGACKRELEQHSGLRAGTDFKLGYSPERINPGDKMHTVDSIVKVISAEDGSALERMEKIYGCITTGGTYKAKSIKVAEAAKVIENAQRDINIAFVNEVAQIFSRLDISVWDVLDTARTKWNFLDFRPGLVGGHCIGVDPYYLAHAATETGISPYVILAGRSLNDNMGQWIADELHTAQNCRAGKCLILGVTFKENVPDYRNSRIVDVARRLQWLGHEVTLHDPFVDSSGFEHEYGMKVDPAALDGCYDLVVGGVGHETYSDLTDTDLKDLLNDGGMLADLKGIWRHRDLGIKRIWTL